MAFGPALASAHVDLTLDDTAFQARSAAAIASMHRMGQRMENVAAVARRMLMVGSAAFAGMIAVGARFEQSMARVRALRNASDTDFRRLSETAKELGRTTVFSASQAAAAMSYFAQSGFEVNEIISAMPSTLRLAAAGQLDMATVAKITAGVMRGMRLDIKDTTTVLDVLAAAATTSSTDIVQLGEGMRYVGAIAASKGKSLNEVTAALQLLANANIQASMGGTALRKILLTFDGARAAGEFAKLNIELRDTSGKLRPLADIIDDMNAAFERLDPLGRARVMAIFGDRAGPGLEVLLGQGGDALREFEARLDSAAGTAQRISEIQLDTVGSAFLLIKSAAESLAITIKEVFDRDIRDSMASVQEAIPRIEAWVAANGAAVKVNVILAAKLGVVLILLPKLIRLVAGLTAGLRAMYLAATTSTMAVAGFGAALGAVAVIGIVEYLRRTNIEIERMKENMRQTTEQWQAFGEARKRELAATTTGERTQALRDQLGQMRGWLARAKENAGLLERQEVAAYKRSPLFVGRRGKSYEKALADMRPSPALEQERQRIDYLGRTIAKIEEELTALAASASHEADDRERAADAAEREASATTRIRDAMAFDRQLSLIGISAQDASRLRLQQQMEDMIRKAIEMGLLDRIPEIMDRFNREMSKTDQGGASRQASFVAAGQMWRNIQTQLGGTKDTTQAEMANSMHDAAAFLKDIAKNFNLPMLEIIRKLIQGIGGYARLA